MGMVLFTQSGTFKPSDYGLSVGDALQIVCVGGGGAGGGSSAGNAGSASSFGSIVTAAGGNYGLRGSQPASQAFSSQGGMPTRVGYNSGGAYVPYSANSACGGDGGHGWWPYTFPSRLGASVASVLLTSGAIALTSEMYSFNLFNFAVAVGSVAVNSTAASAQAGGTGGCQGITSGSLYYLGVSGAGGVGYGAGGGGCGFSQASLGNVAAGSGGNGGQVITHNLILNSSQATTAHTITVGAGGTATRGPQYGGDGANGCVAVFW